MGTMLSRTWWILALRGLCAVLFGILAFVWPHIVLLTLVLFFGAYAVIDGLFASFGALAQRKTSGRWWVMLLEGLTGIAIGALTFFWPAITTLILLYLIAFWAIVTGILEISAALWLRKEISGEWLLTLSGIASVLFGLVLVLRPGAGALAITWLIAAYAIVFGVMLLSLAFRLRRWSREGIVDNKEITRKWSAIRGLPVITIAAGKNIGTVEDFYLDPSSPSTMIPIRALRIKTAKGNYRALPTNVISSIGLDAVVIADENLLRDEQADDQLSALPLGQQAFSLQVFSEGGTAIGTVGQMVLDLSVPTALRIAAFELADTGNFLHHLSHRFPAFAANKRLRYGPDVIVIPNTVARELTH